MIMNRNLKSDCDRFTGYSLLCRDHPELSDAPGASPRLCGAPFAMTSYYLYTKNEVTFPVIQPHRNWGMPTRRGQSPQERQTSLTKRAGSIGSANTGIMYPGALP